jgi:hypothetical protein
VELRSEILESSGCDALPAYAESEMFRRHSRDYPLVFTTGGRLIEGFHQNARCVGAVTALPQTLD